MIEPKRIADASLQNKETLLGGSLAAFREDVLHFFIRLHQEQGTIARFRLGPQKFYAFFDPEMLKEVMVTKAIVSRKRRRSAKSNGLRARGLL